jgi:hypothetical protein
MRVLRDFESTEHEVGAPTSQHSREMRQVVVVPLDRTHGRLGIAQATLSFRTVCV